jgi:hypothetical protein
MDELLQKAIERRDKLRAELEAVDRFIASYAVLQDAMRGDEPLFKLHDDVPPPKSKAQHAATVKAALDDAIRMIRDEGKPLTRGELVRRLEAAGHQLEGADKNKVLGTNMWRSGRFINIKGVGYWPKGTPVPQAYAGLPRTETSIR